jgi:hypothetical protein
MSSRQWLTLGVACLAAAGWRHEASPSSAAQSPPAWGQWATKHGILQYPGCACGMGVVTLANRGRFQHGQPGRPFPAEWTHVLVPGQVSVKRRSPVQIKFDATPVCLGQGMSDPNGVYVNPHLGDIVWDGNVVQRLNNTQGTATYNAGFATVGPHSVHIQFTVQCVDRGATGCAGTCAVDADVPVQVTN